MLLLLLLVARGHAHTKHTVAALQGKAQCARTAAAAARTTAARTAAARTTDGRATDHRDLGSLFIPSETIGSRTSASSTTSTSRSNSNSSSRNLGVSGCRRSPRVATVHRQAFSAVVGAAVLRFAALCRARALLPWRRANWSTQVGAAPTARLRRCCLQRTAVTGGLLQRGDSAGG